MITEEQRRQQFADWFNQQLEQRGWTQGKLLSQSAATEAEPLSSAAVSRYSTGKMLPDVASCQKIAHVFHLPVEVVLRKATLIDPLPEDVDWVQKAIDDLAYAVEKGQLSEAGRLAIISSINRERRLQELEAQREHSRSEVHAFNSEEEVPCTPISTNPIRNYESSESNEDGHSKQL